MKINWNTFGDEFEYRGKEDNGRKKGTRYLYKFELYCPNCNEEYIYLKTKKGDFCTSECRNEYKKKQKQVPYREISQKEVKSGINTNIMKGTPLIQTKIFNNGEGIKKSDHNIYRGIFELTNFLNNPTFIQRLGHIVNEIYDFIYCDYCGVETTKFVSFQYGYHVYCSKRCKNKGTFEKSKLTKEERYGDPNYKNTEKIKQTNLERYGVENVSHSQEIKNKISEKSKDPEVQKRRKETYKKTCLEKYGVENTFQLEETRNKIKQTSLERYGTEHPFQNEEIKEKYKQTCLDKYGVEWGTSSDEGKEIVSNCRNNETEEQKRNRVKKQIETQLEKYGVEGYSQTDEWNEKIEQTMLEKYDDPNYNNYERRKQTLLEKYGVEHPSHIPDKNKKSMYQWHNYTLPSGKEIKLQGYEPYVLDILLDNYLEEDILYKDKDMPEIWYYNDSDGKWHRYFPDFYIPKENLIIEVKSDYTYKADLNRNQLKEEATKHLGFNYELFILNDKKEITNGSQDTL